VNSPPLSPADELFMVFTCPRMTIELRRGNSGRSASMAWWTSAAPAARSRPRTLAKTSKIGCTL
jgi:hypothetical protein